MLTAKSAEFLQKYHSIFSLACGSLFVSPAYAGKSHRGRHQVRRNRDHPRMCGEKASAPAAPPQWQGSPPHVRGKGLVRSCSKWPKGITPACAGKSWTAPAAASGCWDHPRMCGEKQMLSMEKDRFSGSPPHVRGKEIVGQVNLGLGGITPACAGKSSTDHSSRQPSRDHPRMCGEKTTKLPGTRCKLGSPPHVRGKETQQPAKFRRTRITPACAGKSGRTFPAARSSWDHPRMCGEKASVCW